MSDELKPCPFCGSGNVALDRFDRFTVYCIRCGCKTRRHITKDRALAAWNRRAGEEPKR
jgi:Lar family restriction alleviation protein